MLYLRVYLKPSSEHETDFCLANVSVCNFAYKTRTSEHGSKADYIRRPVAGNYRRISNNSRSSKEISKIISKNWPKLKRICVFDLV